MISTPLLAIGETSTPCSAALRSVLPGAGDQRIIGSCGFILRGDVDPDAANLALVRNVARLDFHHQREADLGNRCIQRRSVGDKNLAWQRDTGNLQQRLAVILGERRRGQMLSQIIRRSVPL